MWRPNLSILRRARSAKPVSSLLLNTAAKQISHQNGAALAVGRPTTIASSSFTSCNPRCNPQPINKILGAIAKTELPQPQSPCFFVNYNRCILLNTANHHAARHFTKPSSVIRSYSTSTAAAAATQQQQQQQQKTQLENISATARHRISIWNEEKRRQIEERKNRVPVQIQITLPDSSKKTANAFEITPMDLAKEISPSQAPDYVIARINGNQLWDMNRPLESDCSSIEFFTFDSELGREVFWHSSSHVLGYALEMKYGDSAYLCDGPPLMQQGGFFYDIFVERRAEETSADSSSSSKLLSVPITEEEYAEIEKYASEVAKRKDRFERMQVSRELALKMFENNRFKREIIEGIPADESITVYRCGSFIDLCRGPHLPHTGKVKAFQLLKSSACYFKGDTERESLQRVYGISFPDAKLLAEWHHQREEAAKRDHRVLGKQQELFMFHEMSPGSAFFYPHGARIFTRLVDFMRREYRRRGYEEVMTPLIFNKDLWVTSGHWQNYKENMYLIQEGDDHLHHHHHHHDHGHDHPDDHHQHEVLMGLKPMNCPGHCLMFASKARSYRELPVRWADFSPLHRAEAAGALSGLTRVRRFHQDDSHIFCTEEQVAAEILGCLDFVHYVYHKIFGFEIQYRLSTRPDKYLGSIELWNAAEEALKQSLEKIVGPGKYELNEGDGAFYGPKIDVVVTDAIQRKHQCATIQLDFQMPRRFRLKYQGEDGSQEHTPVIIHRAILGSVERFMAMLAEHTAGKWPFWLSPRQCVVCPVSERFLGYAEEVRHTIEAAFEDRQAHVRVDVDTSDKTLSKKIRDAQLAQYNYILVVGEKELEAREVNVRSTREDNVVRGSMSVEQLIAEFRDLIANYK